MKVLVFGTFRQKWVSLRRQIYLGWRLGVSNPFRIFKSGLSVFVVTQIRIWILYSFHAFPWYFNESGRCQTVPLSHLIAVPDFVLGIFNFLDISKDFLTMCVGWSWAYFQVDAPKKCEIWRSWVCWCQIWKRNYLGWITCSFF